MTKIYLVRHAEAEGNYYRRIHGQYDSKITPRGYRQIDALAERFKDISIDAVYSSDLTRSTETAKSISRYQPELAIITSPGLREINMGSWEDLPWGNATYDDPEQMFNFSSDPDKWQIDGSESFGALKTRIADSIQEIAAEHDGQTVAVFSHGMAIRSFISVILDIPSEQINEILHGDNTCVALLYAENGSFSIKYYNDNSHLSEDLSTFANQSWWKDEKKKDLANMRILPMNVETDENLYMDCYEDAWSISHGSLTGFSPGNYLANAKRVSELDSSYLVKAYYGDDFAGIIELDPDMMGYLGAGWLSFCYLKPELRGINYGTQLIGHAVSVFRKLGRRSLRLHVSETNTGAVSFYEKMGFKLISSEKGIIAPLLLLELPI